MKLDRRPYDIRKNGEKIYCESLAQKATAPTEPVGETRETSASVIRGSSA